MNYQQTLDYLYDQLPMFHRIGAAAYKANLDNTLAICSLLQHPEHKFKSIHIAGTNGKGSSSHMLAAVFQQAGYKTGLYTSPHLLDFRERIRINGKMIPKKRVTDFVKKYKSDFQRIQPSFFEWTVGLAFDYFAAEKIDIAIIETGLGGRLDSTNVIQPIVSLITNISYDHQTLLGNTLQKIAGEKAGIIKKKTPVVISQHQTACASVFLKKAAAEQAPLVFASREIQIAGYAWEKELLHVCCDEGKQSIRNYQLDLSGTYQLKNLPGVLKTLEIVRKKGWTKLTPATIQLGLSHVKKLTGLMGRWQVLQTKPFIIADTGHNEEGIKEVLTNLSRYTYRKLHIVLGMVNDKDVSRVLQLLPATAHYYYTRASVPRAMNEKELAGFAAKVGLNGRCYPNVGLALQSARKKAGAEDLIFIGGSTFVVADALAEEAKSKKPKGGTSIPL